MPVPGWFPLIWMGVYFMLVQRFFLFVAAFAVAALAPLAAFAQSPVAGTITLLNGQAQVSGPATPAHALAKGDPVYAGDVVETLGSSYALIRFTDQGSVLLRPNTRFQLEKYQYKAAEAPAAAPTAAAPLAPLQVVAASEPDSNFFRLLKGSLRAVSGLVAHADYRHYLLSTPVATMGIRGTDFVVALCDAACQNDPTVLQNLPKGETLDGAVIAGVNQGEIVVTSFTGSTTTLSATQYVVTLADGTQYPLGGVPGFLSTDAAAVVETGVAAGSSAAAAGTAEGNVLADIIAGATVAAVIGVVITTTNDNHGPTSTTGTAPAVAGAHGH